MKKAKLALVISALLTLAACGGSESSVSPSSVSDSTSVKESSSNKKSSTSSSKESSSLESSEDSSVVSSEDSSSSEGSSSSSSIVYGLDYQNPIAMTFNSPTTVTNIRKANNFWYSIDIATAGTYSIKLSGGSASDYKCFYLYDSTYSGNATTALAEGKTSSDSNCVYVDYNFSVGTYLINTYYISDVPSYAFDYQIEVMDKASGYNPATAYSVDLTKVETTGFDVDITAYDYAYYSFTLSSDKYLQVTMSNVNIVSGYDDLYVYISKNIPSNPFNYFTYESDDEDFKMNVTTKLVANTPYFLYFYSESAATCHVTFEFSDDIIPDGTFARPFSFNETSALATTGVNLQSSYYGLYYKFVPATADKYVQLNIDLSLMLSDVTVSLYEVNANNDSILERTFTAGTATNTITFPNKTDGSTQFIFKLEEDYGATIHDINVKMSYLNDLPEDGSSINAAIALSESELSTGKDITGTSNETFYKFQPLSGDGKYLTIEATLPANNYDSYAITFYDDINEDYVAYESDSTTFTLTYNKKLSSTAYYYFNVRSYYGVTATVKITYSDNYVGKGTYADPYVVSDAQWSAGYAIAYNYQSYYGSNTNSYYKLTPTEDKKYVQLVLDNTASTCDVNVTIYSSDSYSALILDTVAAGATSSLTIPQLTSTTSTDNYFSIYCSNTSTQGAIGSLTITASYVDTLSEDGKSMLSALTLNEADALDDTKGVNVKATSTNNYYKYTPDSNYNGKYLTVSITLDANNTEGFDTTLYDSTTATNSQAYKSGSSSYSFIDETAIDSSKTYIFKFNCSSTAGSIDAILNFSYSDDLPETGTSFATAKSINEADALLGNWNVNLSYNYDYYKYTPSGNYDGQYLTITVTNTGSESCDIYFYSEPTYSYELNFFVDGQDSETLTYVSSTISSSNTYYFRLSSYGQSGTATIQFSYAPTLAVDGKTMQTAYELNETAAANNNLSIGCSSDKVYYAYTPSSTHDGEYLTITLTDTGSKSVYAYIYTSKDSDSSEYDFDLYDNGDYETETLYKPVSSSDTYYFEFSSFGGSTVSVYFEFASNATENGESFGTAYTVDNALADAGTWTVSVNSDDLYYRVVPESANTGKYLQITITPNNTNEFETYLFADNISSSIAYGYSVTDPYVITLPQALSTSSYIFLKFSSYNGASATIKFDYLDEYYGSGDSNDPYIIQETTAASDSGYDVKFTYSYLYYSFTTTQENKYMKITIDATNTNHPFNIRMYEGDYYSDSLIDETITKGSTKEFTIATPTTNGTKYLFTLDSNSSFTGEDTFNLKIEYLDSLD